MAVKRVTPDEAARLIGEGWSYVDVRSEAEFEQGHPRGAYNIPFMHFTPGSGMTPNKDFLNVFNSAFGADDPVIVGCKSGARSMRAAEALAAAGYTGVVDMRGGFGGEPDRAGGFVCEGWRARGLPVSGAAEQGRSYKEIKARFPSGG
ncbi:MAG: rhodanese-like domain-containing protein [Candidatus Binatia bacterium]